MWLVIKITKLEIQLLLTNLFLKHAKNILNENNKKKWFLQTKCNHSYTNFSIKELEFNKSCFKFIKYFIVVLHLFLILPQMMQMFRAILTLLASLSWEKRIFSCMFVSSFLCVLFLGSITVELSTKILKYWRVQCFEP